MSYKTFPIRAAAVLTTSEVNGTAFPFSHVDDGRVSVLLEGTIGSLDQIVFRFYVSRDDSTYYAIDPVEVDFGGDDARTVTISAPGWKHLRVSAQGYGTVTNSSATVTALYGST